MGIKKLAVLSVLTAVSLAIFVAEAQIPMPMVGVKLGLANIITLCSMAVLGRKEALLIFIIRALLGSMFAGGFSAFIFSLFGGLCAWCVMAALIGVFGEKLIWVTSIFGALAHNAGQLVAAIIITKSIAVAAYAPILAIAAILAGAFTGITCHFLIPQLRKITDNLWRY